MDELDVYRLADTYSLTHAAALICGVAPSQIRGPGDFDSDSYRWHIRRRDDNDDTPEKYDAVLNTLKHAVERGTLEAEKRYLGKYIPEYVQYVDDEEGDGRWVPVGNFDPAQTLVDVDDLRAWLLSLGWKPEFFFRDAPDVPGYLDPNHPHFAYKMYAAIWVWQAVQDKNTRDDIRRGGMSLKTGMEHLLKKNYKKLGLLHRRDSAQHGYKAGDMNLSAISEVAKIANSEEEGGAPRAPGE